MYLKVVLHRVLRRNRFIRTRQLTIPKRHLLAKSLEDIEIQVLSKSILIRNRLIPAVTLKKECVRDSYFYLEYY